MTAHFAGKCSIGRQRECKGRILQEKGLLKCKFCLAFFPFGSALFFAHMKGRDASSRES